jgi:hypothetical protein
MRNMLLIEEQGEIGRHLGKNKFLRIVPAFPGMVFGMNARVWRRHVSSCMVCPAGLRRAGGH